MSRDAELLRRYVKERSESAFSELVQEHLNLVYSVALRASRGDGAQAEDVSQAVFIELAHRASRLLDHPSVAGWLYITTRLVAANTRRAEQRRRRREEEAQRMNSLLADEAPSEVWQRIRPVLDDALGELSEADREAVLLRFLEERPLHEVGARLGLSENAARMRVERALEKLRGLLARRGVTSTASGLAAALAVGVVTPAPAALGASVANAALASAATAGSTTFNLLGIMSMAKVKIVLIGTLVVAGIAVPVWQQARLQRMQSENEQLRAKGNEIGILRDQVGRLRKVEADQAELERLRAWQAQAQPELMRLRGVVGNAGEATKEAADLRAQRERESTGRFEAARQALEHALENNLFNLTNRVNLSAEQVQAAREIMMRQSQAAMVGLQNLQKGKATAEELSAYGKALGNTKEQIKALLTPEQRPEYAVVEQEETAGTARVEATLELRQMQSTLGLTTEQQDQVFAALYDVIFNHMSGSSTETVTNADVQCQWLFDQKAKALESVLTAAQLERYRQEYARERKFFKTVTGSRSK